MIRAYVTCDVGLDTDAIDEHLEFATLPRVGDYVRVDFPEYSDEIEVVKVIHVSSGDGESQSCISPAILECRYVTRIDRD